ncbi:MAG TPA: hypothetical protein VJG32_06320 [Anaerolineae bacterium]|nr:hypothetical protein [Anaerolineae bacterium]
MQQPPMQARPTGITILAALAAIGGVLGLCGSLALIGLGGVLGGVAASVGGAAVGVAAGGLAVIFGLVALGVSVLDLAFAYGAWNLKPWAWTLGVVAQGISLVLAVINILQGADISGQIISIAIAGIILYYLMTPEVKRAFGRA